MQISPKEAMLMAIEEGRKGAGFVSPNPLVGCVILDKNSQLIGKGYHARVGDPHAEVNALAGVADRSQLDGAHLFVTLEPCAHQGRTPACAKILAELPIASVTFGLFDPNPLVSGKGAEILRQAGKTAQQYLDLQLELEELTEIFLLNMRERRAFTTLKVASSLDGQVALGNGESQWITGEEARAHVHFLRGCHDAVLVGYGTFATDNPRLNSRHPSFENSPQRVVILDPEGKCLSQLEQSALWKVRKPEEIYVVTGAGVKMSSKAQQIPLPMKDGELELRELLVELNRRSIHSVFVEGGAQTYAGFLRQKLADRLCVFFAPKILGDGLSWTSDLKVSDLKHAIQVKGIKTQSFGPDLMITGTIAR